MLLNNNGFYVTVTLKYHQVEKNMDLLIITVLLFFLISAVVMPWVNYSSIHTLGGETGQLRAIVKELVSVLAKEGIAVLNIFKPMQLNPLTYTVDTQEIEEEIAKSKSVEPTYDEIKGPNFLKTSIGFEQKFGEQFSVWLGDIAFVFAGFFLVKYSIENSLISPIVRISLGGMLGAILLYAANCVHRRPCFF